MTIPSQLPPPPPELLFREGVPPDALFFDTNSVGEACVSQARKQGRKVLIQ